MANAHDTIATMNGSTTTNRRRDEGSEIGNRTRDQNFSSHTVDCGMTD
jgi:hypothetical protein